MNDTVSVDPLQSMITTYNYIIRGLYNGINYTITVTAGNVLGGSDSTLANGTTMTVTSTPSYF